MKNYEIMGANNAIGEMADLPIKGRLKFKLFKLKVALENEALLVQESLKDTEDNAEKKEIMETENDTAFNVTFTFDELDPLDLSLRIVSGLSPFIKDLKDDDE